MTAMYSIFVELERDKPILTSGVAPGAVEAVVPAYADQDGLNKTLLSLDQLGLNRIVVVDDGSPTPLQVPVLSTPLALFRHDRNKGAAAARNTGLRIVESDWVYFTDCGCTHSANLLHAFSLTRSLCGPSVSAIIGPVESAGHGRLGDYYTHQGILNPPVLTNAHGIVEGETIVTANVLVSRHCAAYVGLFDEAFPSAGGEDTDLGLRLRTVGEIGWSANALVFHDFMECLEDFDQRMLRYGRGMRLVASKHRLDLCPRPFMPFDPDYTDLANRQYEMMLRGYEE